MSKKHGRANDTVEVVNVPKSEVAKREEAMLAFWQEHDIFNKSLQKPAGEDPKGDYIFYDGPPFATGLPHYGHILAGTMKDAIPRFWTMNGYHVRRQWGWDCHGLPVENLIEKKLGLATKRDIEEYGIKKFNETARESVMEYADDWRAIIPRMGRFVDMEHDYKTMDSTYIESVWWVFKQLYEKGLVFEGFKSMHLSPRSGTTLSNFEVNLGYQDIKDIAVTVRLPLLDEAGDVTDTALLVWTTTPWTLPGNLAAAVHNDLEYVTVEVATDEGKEKVILATERLAQLGEKQYAVLETMRGSALVGRKYQPPFPWLGEQTFDGKDKAWTIYHADFVEVGEEGTGAVHIAPAYGEDDLLLAQREGVPIVHHVDYEGRFMDFVTDFAGQLVKPKDDKDAEINHMDADIEVVRALAARGKLFAKEKITHSYPHDWRNGAPLINYATTSWFVEVTKIKDELVAANRTVNWVPEHVGTNRFGKWLEGARDWAVSRQRYWGAPLPIWRNPKTDTVKVFGSLAELQAYVPKSGNQYFLTRHGESVSNVERIISADPEFENGVTEEGKQQVTMLAASLKDARIDLIYYSPLQRTRETAEQVAKALALPADALVADERLLEISFGEYEKKSLGTYHADFSAGLDRLRRAPEGGENWAAVKQRVGSLLYELETTHSGKNILLVSHGGTLQMVQAAAAGDSLEETARQIECDGYDMQNAELRPLAFTPLPHNDHYELDFHRPYIDDFVLEEDGVRLERIPDVFDCWFESGSMPYGQFHYPFACADTFEQEHFPAQFIAEGLDQTRGWFYSLLVLGVALFGKSPFENVIVNGLVLAEDGKKMSKSLQNYPDPMELANRVGIDAMRFYLLSSPIIRAEDLNFSEQEVLELQRKNIGRLHNVLAMYEMFEDGTAAGDDSDNVLDTWIVARRHQIVAETTEGYKNYELDKATRPITDFIDDLSVWYLRRSRDRLKGEDEADKQRALATLRSTLRTLALAIAPAMPFYAEYLWQAVKEDGDAESVHLGKWPEGGTVYQGIIDDMQAVREVVTAALETRTKANLKVRQPIASVTGPHTTPELQAVVLDELNAKEYLVGETVAIDTTLTPELLAEGAVRELMRAVQGRGKADGLAPTDRISLTIDTNEAGQAAITAHEELLTKTVGASELSFSAVDGETLEAGEFTFSFQIEKVAQS